MLGRVKRVDDERLLRGSGTFVGDIQVPGQLELAFLRSPHAHARVLSVDVARARAHPGVLAVFTGADLAAAVRPLRPRLRLPGFNVCEHPCLATDTVRFVGQTVAAVVAVDRYVAEDATELIDVDYEPLPVVVDARTALDPGAPILHAEWGSNVHAVNQFRGGDPEAAFEQAAFVVAHNVRTARYTGVPMENRAVLAQVRPGSTELTVWSSTQMPHLLRTALADALGLAEHAIRVIAPDVGGGFGIKAVIYPEELAVPCIAQLVGRPVRWLEDRREHMLSALHARQQDLRVEAAAASDGRLLAVRFDSVGDVGAYSVYPQTSALETLQTGRHLPGPYAFTNLAYTARAVVTNKSPVGPCRAVSRPVGSLVMESLMDAIAERTGLDRADVRRRNMVQPGQFPYTSVTGQIYDSGSYVESLDKVLEMIDYRGFCAAQRAARLAGRYVGLGMASYVEQTAQGSASFSARGMDNLAGYDSAVVRLDPSGTVSVAVGVSDHGQSHHTTLAQVAAQELGVALGTVRVVHGDTALTPYGMGTFTSRSAVCGGGAVYLAARKLQTKIRAIAAHLLETAPEDVEIAAGVASVRGLTARRVDLREIARVAYFDVTRLPPDFEPELEASGHYDVGGATYSNGSHAGIVEVDPETGVFRFVRYCVVEDCGTMINPMVVDGQVHGGIAQGIGGAAYEHLVYDPNGQLLTASFADYLVPTAMEVPALEVEHLVSPSPLTPLGIKGMGEGGTVAPGSVLALALADALRPFGARFTELPITPETVRRAVRGRRPTPLV